jgi:hypothetical protein
VSELFDEVDEEVRRDQLKKLWDRYSIVLIAGALLIIAAVGGWRGYQYLEAKKAAEAGAAFDKAAELAEQNKYAVGISHAGAAARRCGSRKARTASSRETV